MYLIPTYFCDPCGHAFTTPSHAKGWFVINDRDEHDDPRCPRCGNPDFELLKPEEELEEAV